QSFNTAVRPAPVAPGPPPPPPPPPPPSMSDSGAAVGTGSDRIHRAPTAGPGGNGVAGPSPTPLATRTGPARAARIWVGNEPADDDDGTTVAKSTVVSAGNAMLNLVV